MNPTGTLSHARRVTLVAIGSVCVGIGTVGVFVPGLPTTVFLLAASWCFARSSERLWRKLHQSRRLGGYLRMAQARSMPVRARVASLAGIWGGIGFAVTRGGAQAPWLVATLVAAGMVGTGFVVSMRRRPPVAVAAPASRRVSCPTAS